MKPPISQNDILSRLHALIHSTDDGRRLALIRIALGLIVLIETLIHLPYTLELYSNLGFHQGQWPAPPPWLAYTFVIAALVGAAMITLGWRTRTALLAIFVIRAYLLGVDSINEKAASSLILVLILTLLFSEAGKCWSIDAKVAKSSSNLSVSKLPLYYLQFHFAQMYFFAGIVKMLHPEWPSGVALSRILLSRWSTDWGTYIGLSLPIEGMRLLSLATIVFEITAPWLLFFSKARFFVIPLGLAFHLGIQMSLSVGTLGPLFWLALILIFPSAETILSRVSKLENMVTHMKRLHVSWSYRGQISRKSLGSYFKGLW